MLQQNLLAVAAATVALTLLGPTTTLVAAAKYSCVSLTNTDESGARGWPGHIFKVYGLQVPLRTAMDCNKYCSQMYPSEGITHSSELQVGGLLQCACFSLDRNTLSSLPRSQDCHPCVDFAHQDEKNLGLCGTENAQNGYIATAALLPVKSYPVGRCVDLTNVGQSGAHGWPGHMFKQIGGQQILGDDECHSHCSTLRGPKNITHSSELQVGGQLQCACFSLNRKLFNSLPRSGECRPCVKFPEATSNDLGVCGSEIAINGFVGVASLRGVFQRN